MDPTRLPSWLRIILVAGLLLLVAGGGFLAYRWYTKPATLTIAVGSLDGEASRLVTAIAGLRVAKENFAAAESRIRDADVAAETGELTRASILQQAGTAVLAQANQRPALALTLLR